MKKLSKEEFVNRGNLIHNNKYDYTKVEYVNNVTNVCIICPEHGEFWMRPGNHLFGQGCPKCGINLRAKKRMSDVDEFVNKSNEIYGGKYDYSKVEYCGTDTKVCIICPEHGEFWQTPYHHINGKVGCPKCSDNVRLTTEEFIRRAIKKHGCKYDYSNVDYKSSHDKVCIICPEHGEFWVNPGNHLYGSGCPKCAGKNKTTDDFVSESIQVHGHLYDYSKSEYKGANVKITIICPEHGEFLISPHSHLRGRGCPKCSNSMLEKDLMCFFDKNNIEYEYQKTFDWLFTYSEKKNASYKMKLDFYLKQYNVAIECQGVQHFERCSFFDRPEYTLNTRKGNDKNKYELCEKNGVRVIYYTSDDLLKYSSSQYFYKNNMFSDICLIMKIIKL